MNKRQMRYICAIADTGSIQKAAAVSGRNPSTLTRGLKGLEEELGAVLFKRTRERLVPTPEGEGVIRLAREILEALGALETWVQERRTAAGDGATPPLPEGPGDRNDTGDTGCAWTEQEIRYLIMIRDQKNISRAAGELYLAQPSLSQMVGELEQKLGAGIFRRGKDGVWETEFGTELINRLERVRDLYRQIRLELEEFKELKKGVITFGIPMNLGTCLLPRIVPVFRERFPGIRIQIRENNSHDLEQLMLSKKIDFCILHLHGEKAQVQYELFFEDPFYLVIPERFRSRMQLPEGRELTREDLQTLRQESFVMVARRQKLRLVVDQILENTRIVPDICCTTKSMETAKRLVAAGMGVTFLPRSYLTLYSRVDGLACYPLAGELHGSWRMAVAYPREGKLPRSSREFLRLLQEILGEMSSFESI